MAQATLQPSFNEMLDALASVKRRTLLVALLEHNPQDVSPVVDTDDETERAVKKQRLAMKHFHLPKLTALGFIEWDRENGDVSKGPTFDEIRPLLELLDDHHADLPGDWR